MRIPLQIHRGIKIPRCTVATVPWTRKTRLHLVSVYGINRGHPDFQTGNARLHADLQDHLAGLGQVPWLIGGDWNIEPDDLAAFWLRSHGVHRPPGPTQKFGRTLDWFRGGPQVPCHFHSTHIIPGTDHVAVSVRLQGALRSTLGFRARQPQGLEADKLAPLTKEGQRSKWEAFFGPPLLRGRTGLGRRRPTS